MNIQVNPSNHKELMIDFKNRDEMDVVDIYMKPKTRSHKFQKVKGNWNGQVSFLRNYRFVPIQFFHILYKLCKENRFEYDFKDVKESTTIKVDLEKLKSIYERAILGDEDLIYDKDQFETIYVFLKNRYNRQNISTSYGKTLVLFVVSVYLSSVNNENVLIVVPKPSLSQQMYSDFMSFSKHVIESKKIFSLVSSGNSNMEDHEDYKIIIANFLIIANKEKENFERFNALMFDEVHRATSKSYKRINVMCKNVTSTRGITGTMHHDFSAETYTMILNSGFSSKTVKKRELIDSGRASDGKIIVKYINSLNEHDAYTLHKYMLDEEEHIKHLDLERKLIRASYPRLKWVVSDIISEYKKRGNTVVFFKDVMHGYGKKIHELLSEQRDISVFYIDQHVKESIRQTMYEHIRNNHNCILVVSHDIASTGISINTLRCGYLAEPIKSKITTGQILGRFMRLSDGKDMFYMIDIVDSIQSSVRKKPNYYEKWYTYNRKDVYHADKFQIEEQRININHKSLF